jgi:NhaA family Na+:H+ antiporter
MATPRRVITVFRSDRYAAIALASAAALGLILANTVAGPGLIALTDEYFGPAPLGLDLSLGHWVTDGLLAVFFFIVAVELRFELTRGELNSWQKAAAPLVSALGGVIVPAALYLAIAASTFSGGWPIPTATDIAFALGIIALVGRRLPPRIRVFLLALAVLDDLVAILIIAVVFAEGLNLGALIGAATAIIAVCVVSASRGPTAVRYPVIILLSLMTWYLVYVSGVHATIAGVALGLFMSPKVSARAAHALLPVNNAVILPLFAFVAALVVIPDVSVTPLSPVFWGIGLALPVGKFVGIMIAGSLIALTARKGTGVRGWDLAAVAAVAGIGFTVSLLMNELALADNEALRDQGVLAVLCGSAVSIVVGGALVAWRARASRVRQKSR